MIGDYQSSTTTTRDLMLRYIFHNIFSFDIAEFKRKFNTDPIREFPKVYSVLQEHKLIKFYNKRIDLTNEGKKWISNIRYLFYISKK